MDRAHQDERTDQHQREPRQVVVRTTIARPRVQTKLRVGAADDPAEREADRIADQVLRNLAQGASAGPAPVRRQPATRIRRSTIATGAVGAAGGPVDPGLQRRISAARSGGSPLPDHVNRRMSDGFGRSFDHVRVHTDANADQLNRQLSARAFTLGSDVFFARGQFQPDSGSGQQLLAHELAHTVQQGDGETAQRTIRRWDIRGGNINPSDAVSTKTIKSGQAVFFLEDAGGETIVVKGDNVPVGINQLFAMIHHQVHGTASILVRPLDNGKKAALKSVIADPAKSNNPTWRALYDAGPAKVDRIVNAAKPANLALFGGAAPADPADKAKLFHIEQIDFQPKVVAMSDASVGGGRAIEDAMAPGAGGGDRGGPKTARAMFGDPKHVEQLGMITAADLFLGNTDRVKAGNFGNWFVDPKGAITLIDNLDGGASGNFRSGEAGAMPALQALAKGALAATAADCVNTMIDGMKRQGDATADDWAATLVKGKARRAMMEEAFLVGLKAGKARIVKLYATNKMSAAGRSAKRAAKAVQAQDKARGDDVYEDNVDYWETLKSRARWLQKH